MNYLSKSNHLSAAADFEDEVALQLRSGPKTEKEKKVELEIQARIRQSTLISLHARTSRLAFDKWQQEGCPQPGDTLKHWFEAEKTIASEIMYPPIL
ncbi:MAG: DUF2934 domain-containing protein [Deltaproteobacteria bacterium]|nr:DUF2934 domain-containing protein [Deltaproteobacteria bacterium]